MLQCNFETNHASAWLAGKRLFFSAVGPAPGQLVVIHEPPKLSSRAPEFMGDTILDPAMLFKESDQLGSLWPSAQRSKCFRGGTRSRGRCLPQRLQEGLIRTQ